MYVPDRFVGKMVAVQIVRPVYVFEYGAHVTYDHPNGEDQMVDGFVPMPILAPEYLTAESKVEGKAPRMKPIERDLFPSVVITATDEDSITFEMLVPTGDGSVGVAVRKTVPSALLLSIDEVVGFEVPMPTVTRRERQQAAPGPTVTLR